MTTYQRTINIPLSDDDWGKVAHLFPADTRAARFGRPVHSPRQLLNAILWVQLKGSGWKSLPAEYPPQQTCYIKARHWGQSGVLQRATQLLQFEPA